MGAQIRKGLRTGLTFGIIVTFLFLIGFTQTAATLFGDVLQDNAIQPGFGLTVKMANMLIFLGLLGVWAGVRASNKPAGETGTIAEALAGAGAAGLVHGLVIGGLAYLVGTLHAA